MSISVAHIFYDAHMGNSYFGLGEILEANTNKSTPRPGEVAVFINSKWTAVKVLGPNNVILSHKGSITPAIVAGLPQHFSGSRMSFLKRLEASLSANFEKKFGLAKNKKAA